MSLLGGAIVEAVVMEYGRGELLRRLSDPFWFSRWVVCWEWIGTLRELLPRS